MQIIQCFDVRASQKKTWLGKAWLIWSWVTKFLRVLLYSFVLVGISSTAQSSSYEGGLAALMPADGSSTRIASVLTEGAAAPVVPDNPSDNVPAVSVVPVAAVVSNTPAHMQDQDAEGRLIHALDLMRNGQNAQAEQA